ncbi:hypothetical protein B447_17511 [Thauera sp. 27]|nr:hypothetical protein B447_17511 [Thauera sp. 27]
MLGQLVSGNALGDGGEELLIRRRKTARGLLIKVAVRKTEPFLHVSCRSFTEVAVAVQQLRNVSRIDAVVQPGKRCRAACRLYEFTKSA